MNIERIKSLPIESVAEALGLKVGRHKCRCPFHADHHPSMSFNRKTNIAHCFVCNSSWDGIGMVEDLMKLDFKAACFWLADTFGIYMQKEKMPQSFFQIIKPKLMNTENNRYLDGTLLERYKGTSNELTRALVQNVILTKEQMQHAAEQYHLSTADDKVIFWQIDQDMNLREGKVMCYQANAHRSKTHDPVTVSWLMKREKLLPEDWKADNCLFGLHLLSDEDKKDSIVGIVESEKTAIVCSELIPTLSSSRVIWLATGGMNNLTIHNLEPMRGRRVIIFPDTDPEGKTFNSWSQTAKEAQKQLGMPFPVSDILELHASADQKSRKIDIADFLLESNA